MSGPAQAAETPIDVSVIVCVRDGAAVIGLQLAALDRQEGAPPFEVVLVDNGSTDGTDRILRAWRDAPGHAARSIRIIDGGREPGIPRARNRGALAARGRVLAFCDADDEVAAGWVAAFARAVDADQLAGGRIRPIEADGTARAGDFGAGLIATGYLPHVGNCNCALPRELFFEVGGYDESLPRYGFEDVDLSWRVQEAGHPIIYVPDAEVRFTLSGRAASVRKRFDLGRGRVLMAGRYPRYDAARYTPTSCGAEMLRAGSDLLRASWTARRPDAAQASRFVAAAGRLTGVLDHRLRGVPQRRLLDADRLAPPTPRIAIASNNGDVGGGEMMLLAIADVLRDCGLAVTVIGPSEPGELAALAAERRHEVEVLEASGRRAYMLALARWRLRYRRVPLWCNGLVPSLATAGMGPRIVHLHQRPSPLHRAALAIARCGARRVLVPSRAVAAVVPRATVLPNWTAPLDRLGPREHAAGQPLRIGFLGRLTRDKGAVDLAHAVALLRAGDVALLRADDVPRLRATSSAAAGPGGDLRLVLAGANRFGDADDDAALSAALAPLGEVAELPGWVDPSAFLAGIDVLVVPSRAPESFGLAAAEAMAKGVPVVVTDAGGLPEVVGPEHPWIAPAGDPEALADVIAAALEAVRTGRADAVVAVARTRWEAEFSPAAGRRRVRALLRSLDGSATETDQETS